METRKSFKGYGKVDEDYDQRNFQNKSRKRKIIISISTIILFTTIIAAVTTVVINGHKSTTTTTRTPPSPVQSLKALCSVTLYPTTCYSSLSPSVLSNTSYYYNDPKKIFILSLKIAKDKASILETFIPKMPDNGTIVAKALADCAELFSDSADSLSDSLQRMSTFSDKNSVDDIRTWLSGALTSQQTCIDGLSEINGTESIIEELSGKMRSSTELISNSLAIVTKVLSIVGKVKVKFPGVNGRKLLQEVGGVGGWEADVVVAKDGSGNFTTIGEAVKVAPVKSVEKFVIYVKEGVYEENVVIGKHVWNVVLIGDGMDKSVVSGKLNVVDGTPTFQSATVAVDGKGFIARDMGFKNTAGSEKHQAVAFRSDSDESIFYRCLFDGYQDTLYVHKHRQFYRECTITGTIDFIFGNAAVVFQKCNIHPRQPMDAKQINVITAQGRKDENENTGISIQKCTISALDDQVTAPTYFGRPWHEFATTVVMQSDIGPVVDPLGWVGWVNGVEPNKTIFYGEYQNFGPGSDVGNRVKWAGYKSALTPDEAAKYTVGAFLDGNEWLASSSVEFDTTL